MEQNEKLTDIGRTLRTQVILLGGLIFLFWFLEGIDWLLGGQLDQYGIAPRHISGLWGIIAAPFLHAGFSHVAANTIPFLVLGWLVLLRGTRTFLWVTAIVILVSGFGTWLIAPSASIHLGASGLIFGYFGYLLFRGYFERSWEAVLLSVIVAILYGGMLFGIISNNPGISWQMHLFGFVGGAFSAYLLSDSRRFEQNPN